ncbi:MAG: dihydrodipicolinate synthase family protein [Deltaproteobacteria bacterium]|nr:dihydrodipicolinate synthase family protein [Deltaproteobacteria bacterium]
MVANKLPRGLIVDLITPLDDTGGIDREGLNAILAKVLPHADGILLAGPQMGEGRGLGPQFKVELFEKASAFVQGKVPLFFWISENSIEATKELLDHLKGILESTGYRGTIFWLDSPLAYHSNRGLYRYYQDLTAITDRAFVLYNDAGLIKLLEKQLKRGNIRTNILKDLSRIEKIVALVFRGSLTRVNNYQKALDRRPDFKIYDGDEARFLEHPSLSGIVSMGANLAPRIWSTVTRASLGVLEEGERKPGYLSQIWEMGQFLKDLMDMYRRNPVWTVKKALSDLKTIKSPACAAMTKAFEEEQSPLAEFIAKHHIE